MAALDLSDDRDGVVANPRVGKTVDVTVAAPTGGAADTITPAAIGLQRVYEVWVKSDVAITADGKTVTLGGALPAGTYRFVGA